MSESTMFADLLAAQMEMPKLQKSAINPHFKNRYVPLEELLQTVLPILNKHNFVLLQMPSLREGQPTLDYQLMHTSGEAIVGVMPLLCAKDDPQGQGSAITYARRYSLMSLLGLTADADDDAEATRKPQTMQQAVRQGVAASRAAAPRAEAPARNTVTAGTVPACPDCGGKMWDNRPKKADGTYSPKSPDAKCRDKECGGVIWNINEYGNEEATYDDIDELPYE